MFKVNNLAKILRVGQAASVRCYSSQNLEVPETGFNFAFTPEQQAFKDLAKKFTAEEIIPAAAKHDLSGEVSIFTRNLMPTLFQLCFTIYGIFSIHGILLVKPRSSV